jgi:hypothetical protein
MPDTPIEVNSHPNQQSNRQPIAPITSRLTNFIWTGAMPDARFRPVKVSWIDSDGSQTRTFDSHTIAFERLGLPDPERVPNRIELARVGRALVTGGKTQYLIEFAASGDAA